MGMTPANIIAALKAKGLSPAEIMRTMLSMGINAQSAQAAMQSSGYTPSQIQAALADPKVQAAIKNFNPAGGLHHRMPHSARDAIEQLKASGQPMTPANIIAALKAKGLSPAVLRQQCRAQDTRRQRSRLRLPILRYRRPFRHPPQQEEQRSLSPNLSLRPLRPVVLHARLWLLVLPAVHLCKSSSHVRSRSPLLSPLCVLRPD